MDFLGFLVMAIVGIVSLSLIFLVIIGTMVAVVFARTSKAPDRDAPRGEQPYKEAQIQIQEPPAISARTDVSAPAASDEDELAAVISAAVAAVCGEEAKVVGTLQPSFTAAKEGLAASAWRTAGRLDNFEGL